MRLHYNLVGSKGFSALAHNLNNHHKLSGCVDVLCCSRSVVDCKVILKHVPVARCRDGRTERRYCIRDDSMTQFGV